MPLASLFAPDRRRERAFAAYRAVVERAREPRLFLAWGVPDTLDGRYEMLALHAFLVLHRLKAEGAATRRFAQFLFDAMFADLDRALREMGASDIGVGKRVKAMAAGFYGRIRAYEEGIAGGAAALEAALGRNLLATAPQGEPAAAARYLRRQVAALAAVPVAVLLDGAVPFAPLEGER
jgi:cytochrome b pre-mRNA-processing protein 3